MPKITRAKKSAASLQLNKVIIQSILDKKGEQIICLDLRKINEAIADYFVICEADNVIQVKAIADNIIEEVRKKSGEKPWHTEGYQNQEWILVDYVNVVAHIFLKKRRQFYQLEDLWADGKKMKLIENGIEKPKKEVKKKTVKKKSKRKSSKSKKTHLDNGRGKKR